MNTVVVKNQSEWDALPSAFEEDTRIEVNSPADAWLSISKIPGSSHAVLRGSSYAVLWESSHAELRESSHAVLRGSSHAELWGSSHAVLWESSHAVLRGSSHAVLWESSHAELWESSHAELRESSHAVLRGSSHAELWGSSHAVLWESSHANHHSRQAPVLNGQAACHYYDGSPIPLSKSDRCIIIQVRRLTGNGGWLEENSVEESDGSVVLYKRVSRDWQTQEGTPNETKWLIGSTVTHPKWAPLTGECGPGKFHACSRPYFCDEFRSVVGDRYIAIRVQMADLHAWDGGSYPHKIAFRMAVVLNECDRYGVAK